MRRLVQIRTLPAATRMRPPKWSKIGPTWMPTKNTIKRYRLKIHPISDEE
jgi:hypothetical protein